MVMVIIAPLPALGYYCTCLIGIINTYNCLRTLLFLSTTLPSFSKTIHHRRHVWRALFSSKTSHGCRMETLPHSFYLLKYGLYYSCFARCNLQPNPKRHKLHAWFSSSRKRTSIAQVFRVFSPKTSIQLNDGGQKSHVGQDMSDAASATSDIAWRLHVCMNIHRSYLVHTSCTQPLFSISRN